VEVASETRRRLPEHDVKRTPLDTP